MRLEDDRIEALRRWGQALRDAGDEEHAPAGRAILMLLEEVERLRLELACTPRERPGRDEPASDGDAVDTGEALAPTLRERVQRAARRGSSSSREEDDAAGSSPEAWIEG